MEDYTLKPQQRNIKGRIKYTNAAGVYTFDLKVYSVPCDRCSGCPLYRIETKYNPTAYYCQVDFAFGTLRKALRDNTIPENCMVAGVYEFRKEKK